MPVSIWKLNQLFGMKETTFATDPSANGALFKKLFAREVVFQPGAEIIEREGDTGSFSRQSHIVGVRGGTLTFKLELKGSGEASFDADSEPSEAHDILRCLLGGFEVGQGGTVAAGTTTTSIQLAGTPKLNPGAILHVNGHARLIKTVDVDGLGCDLNAALPAIPANGTQVQVGTTYYLDKDSAGTMAFHGDRDGIFYTFLGCKLTAKLEGVTAKGVALLAISVEVATWHQDAKANLSETIEHLGTKPPVVKGSSFWIDGVASLVTGLDIDLGITTGFQETTEGAEGKSGAYIVDAKPSGTIKPYHDPDNMTRFLAATEMELAFACGFGSNGAGANFCNAWGIFIPAGQYMQPNLEEVAGMAGESIQFMANASGDAFLGDFTLSLL